MGCGGEDPWCQKSRSFQHKVDVVEKRIPGSLAKAWSRSLSFPWPELHYWPMRSQATTSCRLTLWQEECDFHC